MVAGVVAALFGARLPAHRGTPVRCARQRLARTAGDLRAAAAGGQLAYPRRGRDQPERGIPARRDSDHQRARLSRCLGQSHRRKPQCHQGQFLPPPRSQGRPRARLLPAELRPHVVGADGGAGDRSRLLDPPDQRAGRAGRCSVLRPHPAIAHHRAAGARCRAKGRCGHALEPAGAAVCGDADRRYCRRFGTGRRGSSGPNRRSRPICRSCPRECWRRHARLRGSRTRQIISARLAISEAKAATIKGA